MRKISIFDAEPGMILAKPVTVLDKSGIELMQAGFVLQKKHIRKLHHWGIESIHIETYDDYNETETVFTESIRFLAHQTYEDAINSLSRMAKNLTGHGEFDMGEASRSVSRVLDVISMEPSLLSLLSMVRESEEYVYQHSVDVCVISLVIARYMDCPREDMLALGTACFLHDIGLMHFKKTDWDKSQITTTPDNIESHPEYSRSIVEKINEVEPEILKIVEQHHEFHDGSGYPAGLSGDSIHPLAQILGICEAYVSLIQPVIAENMLTPHEAITIILDPSFKRFPPNVLRAFISNISIYPAGTFVQLNNSIRAVVISSNTDKPMRPKILVLFEDETKPVKPFPVDLSSSKYYDWFIEKVVPAQNLSHTIAEILKF